MASFLITDDSSFSRAMLKEILTDNGHTVMAEACDGEEAVSKYEELKPDILTLDLEMPKMGGIQAAELILRKNPDANIILITSITNKREINTAKKRGVKEAIHKPVDPKELMTAIQNML